MSDIATALMSALGLGKKQAPMAAPPDSGRAPWESAPGQGPVVMPHPDSTEGGGGAAAMGGSGSTDRDALDQLMMEIMKQKQKASVLGGQLPPG